jgi:hypothetical protein
LTVLNSANSVMTDLIKTGQIRPFPAAKIQQFLRIRFLHTRKPPSTKNHPIWRTFWKIYFFTSVPQGLKSEKFFVVSAFIHHHNTLIDKVSNRWSIQSKRCPVDELSSQWCSFDKASIQRIVIVWWNVHSIKCPTAKGKVCHILSNSRLWRQILSN